MKKKKAIITVVVVLAVAAIGGLIAWLTTAPKQALETSILEPLSDTQISLVAHSDTSFSGFCKQVELIRKNLIAPEDQDRYAEINYGRLHDFLKHYSNKMYCDKIKDQAELDYKEGSGLSKRDFVYGKLVNALQQTDPLCYELVERMNVVTDNAFAPRGFEPSPIDDSEMEKLSSEKLTDADLAGKSADELRLMRNYIYAVHNYKFRSTDLQDYFSRFDWYEPENGDMQAVYGELSAVERYNVEFIKSKE